MPEMPENKEENRENEEENGLEKKMNLKIFDTISEMVKEFKGMSKKWKITILTLTTLLVAVIVGTGFMGCATASDAYIDANYENANTALPDLITYIEKDESLSDLDKEVRIKSVETWWDLIKYTYESRHESEGN